MIDQKMIQNLTAILRLAEKRFGSRMGGWKINPVDVAGSSFPETIVDPAGKTVQVRITASTRKYPMQATYQLAHEAIHCLAPVGRRDTIFFEEGLATHFALTYPDISPPDRARRRPQHVLEQPGKHQRAANPIGVREGRVYRQTAMKMTSQTRTHQYQRHG